MFCLEGIDGAGKSTQARLLADFFGRRGKSCAIVAHPGHTYLGRQLREILLHERAASDLARRLLFWADALETAASLPEVDVVICDRHTLYSSYAYGLAAGVPREFLLRIEELCRPYVRVPDATLLLDLPVSQAVLRLHARGCADLVERAGAAFLENVRRAYHSLAARFPEVAFIRAAGTVEEVFARIVAALEDFDAIN